MVKFRNISLILMLALFAYSNITFGNNLMESSKNLLNSFNLSAKNNNQKNSNQLTNKEVALGLKDALYVGVDNVVKRLGKYNGFFDDPAVHIKLPKNLRKIKSTLNRIGMKSSLDELEVKMNRAAEISASKSKKLFVKAIKQMRISDVMDIYRGGDDAITKYFKSKMENELKDEMRPLVENTLSEVAAYKTYNSILKSYNSIPFTKHIGGNISEYVLDKTIDGIFYYLAKEEKAIRNNPLKRTTDLLKKLFSR
jgi:hypothetical protein